MPKTFLDLTHYDSDRSELRRLEKSLKKSPEFDSKSGRIFFFRFATEQDKLVFYASMLRAMSMTGWKAVITEAYESDLIKQ